MAPGFYFVVFLSCVLAVRPVGAVIDVFLNRPQYLPYVMCCEINLLLFMLTLHIVDINFLLRGNFFFFSKPFKLVITDISLYLSEFILGNVLVLFY